MAPPAAASTAALLLLAAARGPAPALGLHGLPKGLGLLSTQGDTSLHLPNPLRCLWGPEAEHRHHSARCQAVYNLALEESGMEAKNVSDYGCNVPKMPYSWVEEILAMDHTKTHNYNFQGAHQWSLDLQDGGFDWPQFSNRNWALEFAKANFSDNDYFELTDVTSEYVPMGSWDHSDVDSGSFNSHGTEGMTANETDEYLAMFDREYFKVMAASNFTLCPGGDMPWSMRFYEAIVAGSIPVIKRVAFDLSAPNLWALWEIPYKYYVLDGSQDVVFRQDWVDHNLELFLKYQTFHSGDLRPPAQAAGDA